MGIHMGMSTTAIAILITELGRFGLQCGLTWVRMCEEVSKRPVIFEQVGVVGEIGV